MKWRNAVMAIAFGLSGASVWACSSDDDASSKSVCPKDDPETATDESECRALATVSAGQQAVVKRRCQTCHGEDMSGSATALANQPQTVTGEDVELFPPNLTSDPTGAAPPEEGGKWGDDALALAIRTGVDNESQALCPQMKHFSAMSDFEVYSIVKYLRSLPPVSKAVPRSVCPPTKTKEQQSIPR